MAGLSSLQRIQNALDFAPVSEIPVAPYISNFAARYAGIPIGEYCTDPAKMAKAHIVTWEEFGYDMVFLQSDNYYIAESLGCKTRIHRDSTVTLEKPALENMDDVFDLQVPDPQKDGRMPVYLEAIRLVKAELKDRVAIRCPGTGPFALASYLIGTERFLLEVAKVMYNAPDAKRDAVLRMLELATETLIAFGKAEFDAGAYIVQCGDSLASLDMISPAIYREFVFPYHKKVVKAWKKYGGNVMLHICGNNGKVLDLHAEVGFDLIEIDAKVPMGLAREKTGGKCALIGNLDPVHVMLRGTPEIVRNTAEACIKEAGIEGFILGTGCEVPVDTPHENVKALIETARRFPLNS